MFGIGLEPMSKRFVMIIDDFYPDPDRVRRAALTLPYVEREDAKGWTTQRYQPAGIKQRIEKALRRRIKAWEGTSDASEYHNGAFFSGFSRGKFAEKIGVHYDAPTHWLTLLLYMTPGAPPKAGTSMWRHRSTGISSNPTRNDSTRLRTPTAELKELLAEDAERPERWEEIGRVGNVYNRAVVFSSGTLHSATAHFGGDKFSGRIFQAFRFSVEQASV